jgi:hypothetical protein
MEDGDLKDAFPFLFRKQEERSKAKQLDHNRIFNKDIEKYQSFKDAVVTTLSNKRSSLSQHSLMNGLSHGGPGNEDPSPIDGGR